MAQPKGTKRNKPYVNHQPPRKCRFPGCDTIFKPTNANQHYCKNEHYYPCEICGTLFRVKDIPNMGKTCSKRCSQKLSEKTMIEHLGVPHALMSSKCLAKARATNLAARGVEYPSQSAEVQAKSRATLQKRNNFDTTKNFNVVSKINRSVASLFEAANIPVKYEFYLEGYRYDIHIPGTNVLIEINPTITHNCHMNIWGSDPKDKYYHRKKTQIAMDHGYVCINIFDWDAIVSTVTHLRFCKHFEIVVDPEPSLHWYRERDKSHVLGTDISSDMIDAGYLPVYDAGIHINYLY